MSSLKFPVLHDNKFYRYCGLTLNWYYNTRTVDITLPGYTPAALHKFQHTTSQLPQHSPHHWNRPNYGAPTHLTPIVDT